jgi:hypothetical protein
MFSLRSKARKDALEKNFLEFLGRRKKSSVPYIDKISKKTQTLNIVFAGV